MAKHVVASPDLKSCGCVTEGDVEIAGCASDTLPGVPRLFIAGTGAKVALLLMISSSCDPCSGGSGDANTDRQSNAMTEEIIRLQVSRRLAPGDCVEGMSIYPACLLVSKQQV